MADLQVTRDDDADRYQATVDGETAVLTFSRREGDPPVLVLEHTVVPDALEGKGVGSGLVAGALADIRSRGERIVPMCPFVVGWLQRHPDQTDVVAGPPPTSG